MADPVARGRGLKAGKLPPELLERLLATVSTGDPRVRLGPVVGEDAAVISFGATDLIATTDPVTFATDLIGWYAVHVNANDIAASGGVPRWFLATVFLPEDSSAEAAEGIFAQLREAADALNVTLVGGHTEVTIGLPRPLVSGVMLGEVAAGESISTGGAQQGDAIIITKGIAIEGAALLAREKAAELAAARVPAELVDRATRYLFDPGISVVEDAAVARLVPGIHAMHDPTEGGLATGLAELAAASGIGLAIDGDAAPVLPEAAEICRALGVDVWGLIASGALLISAAPERADQILDELRKAGIAARVIGHATAPGDGLVVTGDGAPRELPSFERDEAARLLGG